MLTRFAARVEALLRRGCRLVGAITAPIYGAAAAQRPSLHARHSSACGCGAQSNPQSRVLLAADLAGGWDRARAGHRVPFCDRVVASRGVTVLKLTAKLRGGVLAGLKAELPRRWGCGAAATGAEAVALGVSGAEGCPRPLEVPARARTSAAAAAAAEGRASSPQRQNKKAKLSAAAAAAAATAAAAAVEIRAGTPADADTLATIAVEACGRFQPEARRRFACELLDELTASAAKATDEKAVACRKLSELRPYVDKLKTAEARGLDAEMVRLTWSQRPSRLDDTSPMRFHCALMPNHLACAHACPSGVCSV